MAKIKTQCQCGGTFDGTPSGRKRHDRTAQHREWSAGQMAEAVAQRARDADVVAEALTPDEARNLPLDADKVSADLQSSGSAVKVALYVVVEVDIDALSRHMGYGFTKREAITAVRQSLYVAATQAAYPEGILTPVSDNR